MLIDEFTGRMMKGRRLSDGLHQAIEAKEGVKIQPENVTLCQRDLPELLPALRQAGGMTGTAATEAEEFMRNLWPWRGRSADQPPGAAIKDEHDQVYRTAREKYEASSSDQGATPRASRSWSAPPRSKIRNAVEPC
jgi:preprotein translocase subunit SecA